MKNTLKKIICIMTAVIISVVSLVVSASAEIIVDTNTVIDDSAFKTVSTYSYTNVGTFKKNSTKIETFNIGIFDSNTGDLYIQYFAYTPWYKTGKTTDGIYYGISTTSTEFSDTMLSSFTAYSLTLEYENIVNDKLSINVNQSYTKTDKSVVNLQKSYLISNFYDKSGNLINLSSISSHNLKYLTIVCNSDSAPFSIKFYNKNYSTTDFSKFVTDNYTVTRDSTTGKILTAGQPTDSENGSLMVSKGWYENTTTIGNMMFLINDHDQKHNYTIKVSENKIIHSIIETQISNYDWYDNTENNWLANILGNAVSVNWNEKLYTVFENLMTTVEWYKLKPYLTDMNEVAFDLKGYIKNDIMDFSKDDPLKRTKIVGVNLSDYINMVRYAVYKVELIDINENRVLDTTYIMANDTRSINSTKLGTVAWQYESNDTALNDLSTNNTPTSYISKINNGVGTYSSNYTTSDPAGYNNENVSNIQDVITDINAYVDQVNGFFKAVYGLFPPEIWNIIYIGFGCVIASAIIKILI